MTTNSRTFTDRLVWARAQRPHWREDSFDSKPETLEEGYRAQMAVRDALVASGVNAVGYKVGSTSSPGQKSYGLSEPVYASIFEDTEFCSLSDAFLRDYASPSVECEIAVRLAKDIPGPDTSRQDVIAALEWCRLGCEVIDGRYPDPAATGVPTLLADGFFNAGFVLGPPTDNWRDIDLSNLRGEIVVNDKATAGTTANVLDPIQSLQWLSRKLVQHGRYLAAGSIVLTGSLVPPVPVRFPLCSLSLSVSGFGRMSLNDTSDFQKGTRN